MQTYFVATAGVTGAKNTKRSSAAHRGANQLPAQPQLTTAKDATVFVYGAATLPARVTHTATATTW